MIQLRSNGIWNQRYYGTRNPQTATWGLMAQVDDARARVDRGDARLFKAQTP